MQNKALYLLSLALIAVISILLIPNTTLYEIEPESPQKATLRPELVPICSCESMRGKYGTPTHYEEDGVTVLLGRVDPNDVGICQINLRYHQELTCKNHHNFQ